MRNSFQVPYAVSLLSAAPALHFWVWNRTPLVLELILEVPVAGDMKSWERAQRNSPLPMAELQTGTLEPESFPVPLEKEHPHANGARVLTFPSLHRLWPTPLQRGAGTPLELSCAAQHSFRQGFMGSSGWILRGYVRPPCAPLQPHQGKPGGSVGCRRS